MIGHSYLLRIVLLATLLFVFACGSTVRAQSSIASPHSILGFKPGADRTIADWGQITNYFARLDSASDRVTVKTIGQSTLGRPLIAAFISAPDNLKNLSKFALIQRRLADPRTIKDHTGRDRLIDQGKVVVAISCSIHSNEIVASQMSMQLAFDLATARDEATQNILRNTIIILIPSPNPDGIDIVANWYRKTLNTQFEGTEPPELYHHYAGHDDNRDWFMLNLRETRAITKLFWQEWFPQIVYDIHQMDRVGPRFFVPPFYPPANPGIDPILLRETGALGYRIAADAQSAGLSGVVTDAMFDAWWHGGFRTAPYYHNAIGILSEAASAKLMTPATVTADELKKDQPNRGLPSLLTPTSNFPDPWRGGAWGPGDIMVLEMSAARSVLSMASLYRTHYLKNFYELGRRNIAGSTYPADPLAYYIPPVQGNDEQVARFIEILLAQGVEVKLLNRELHTAPPGSREMHEAPAGGYLVWLAQPTRANVRALFEQQVYPADTAAGQDRPYDVAGWTLPMMMGVEYMPVGAMAETNDAARGLTAVTDPNQVRHDMSLNLLSGKGPAIASPIRSGVRIGVYKSWRPVSDEGWTRFMLDTFSIPFRSLSDAEIRAGDLRTRFDVVILPSQTDKQIVDGNAAGAYPAQYTGGISASGVASLRAFVEAGGTLICFDAATEMAIKRFDLPVKNVLADLKQTDFFCPGSILRLDVDIKHPLGQSLRPETDAYFINSSAFEIIDDKRATPIARYANDHVLRSGWLRGEKYLAGKVALAEVTLGRGRVILFGFRPQHRGQTWGTFPFIFNALERVRN